MTRLYLVRHGETQWTREGRLQGQTDVTLSTEGRNQARALAKHLAKTPFDAAYSSDLSRASETANLILSERADSCPQLVIDQRLREISDGVYEGWLVSQAAERDPRLVERMDGGLPAPDFVPPKGESVAQLYLRQLAVASLLREQHEAQQVLVVGHSWALRALAAAFLGEGSKGFWKRQSPHPASISTLEVDQESASVVSWSDTQHLANAMPGSPRHPLADS